MKYNNYNKTPIKIIKIFGSRSLACVKSWVHFLPLYSDRQTDTEQKMCLLVPVFLSEDAVLSLLWEKETTGKESEIVVPTVCPRP